jgi:NAD(P)-dependent dehydrogenase (short-subunit alcohol dehydrogenase family)
MGANWLDGQVSVVTGASRGIGRAVGIALSEAGSRVFLAARDEEALEEVAESIRAKGGEAIAIPCDVSDEAQVKALFHKAQERGSLKVLVCAAGILEKSPLGLMSLDLWQRVLSVNLTGTFLCAREAFAFMEKSGGGRIITLSSLSGVYGTEKFPGLAAYNVSKNGVLGLTEAIAVEGREKNISAICLSPGAVDTQMLREANPDLTPGLTPEDVAKMIVSLLDEAIAPASGANIMLFSNR